MRIVWGQPCSLRRAGAERHNILLRHFLCKRIVRGLFFHCRRAFELMQGVTQIEILFFHDEVVGCFCEIDLIGHKSLQKQIGALEGIDSWRLFVIMVGPRSF